MGNPYEKKKQKRQSKTLKLKFDWINGESCSNLKNHNENVEREREKTLIICYRSYLWNQLSYPGTKSNGISMVFSHRLNVRAFVCARGWVVFLLNNSSITLLTQGN